MENNALEIFFNNSKSKLVDKLKFWGLDSLQVDNIVKRLSNLKILQFEDNQKTYHLNCIAFYSPSNNAIYYKSIKHIFKSHTLLHEMVHSLPVKNKNNHGFVKNKTLHEKNDNFFVKFSFGIGFNEGFTELLGTLINEETNPNYYLFLTNIMDSINKYCGLTNSLNKYISSDIDDYISYIQKSFNLPSSNLIYKLIFLTDKLFYCYMSKPTNKVKSDILSISMECYKIILDIIILSNKKNQNIIKSFNWSTFFSNFGLTQNISKKTLNKLNEELKIYYIKSLHRDKFDNFCYENLNYMQTIATMILNCVNKKESLFKITKYNFLTTQEFYDLILNFDIKTQNSSINSISDNYKMINDLVLTMFLNPAVFRSKKDPYYFSLIQTVLTHPLCTNAKAYKVIPKNLLINYLSENSNYYLLLLDHDFKYFCNFLNQIPLTDYQYQQFKIILYSKKEILTNEEFSKYSDQIKNINIKKERNIVETQQNAE